MTPEDVPPGPLLLDTTAVSHLMRGGAIGDRLAELTANHQLVISFVTVGEMLSGAIAKGWGERKMAELELRLAGYGKVAGSEKVARAYGRLRARFGTSQKDNDLWIAACALAEDDPPPIVTTDGDFDEIGTAFGLTIIRPD